MNVLHQPLQSEAREGFVASSRSPKTAPSDLVFHAWKIWAAPLDQEHKVPREAK